MKQWKKGRKKQETEKSDNVLTVSRAVKSIESIKVRILETLMISVKSPHHTGPRLTKNEISLSFALNHVTVLVKKLRQNPEERKCLRIRMFRTSEINN